MMKLSDFRITTDAEYDSLRMQVDNCPERIPLLFDVQMPDGCTPNENAIGFYRDSGRYIAYFEAKPQYAGENIALEHMIQDGGYATDDWKDMVAFCRSLPDEDAVLPDSCTNINVTDITDFDAVELPSEMLPSALTYEFIRNELRKTIIGQDLAVDMVAYQVASFLNKPNPKRPLTLLFHGAPATGKSELAKAIGELLSRHNRNKYSVTWVDLNTYTEAHTVHNLTGAPASYIGHDETPVFYSVAENPYTLFIWDEVEKSHPAVLRLFMGIMDEGRCASNKELPDHTREYDFKRSIHVFTTNSPIGELSAVKKNPIGFITNTDIEAVSYEDDAVSVSYKKNAESASSTLVQQIYDQNEKARRALVRTGVLPEIATRFSSFVEFVPLSDQAKIRIIAKTILNTGFEYGIRLKYIAPNIIQEMVSSAGKDGFSVRSYRTIAEGYLSSAFCATQGVSGGDTGEYRLEGTLTDPLLIKA